MKYFLIFVLVVGCLSAEAQPSEDRYAIIPEPARLESVDGSFTFSQGVRLVYNTRDALLATALAPLEDRLHLAVSRKVGKKDGPFVQASLDPSITSEEGYILDVRPSRVDIRARTAAGVFYAVQTLLQLLPPQGGPWTAPCVRIEDAPRFAYRGVMLDVARHYMPLDFLYQLVDLLAMQKMNRLHLHLTDSQGWRFQSLKYPKLTEVGAYRKGDPLHTTYDYASRPEDTLYGGYYTQDQLRALVRYAASRFITIVPEIEMPSHSQSAIASYPWLSCLDSAGRPYPYPQDIQNEYCTKDSVFTFLEGVLSEVIQVFPGTYIHIGGDEASKEDWKVCPYDQRRMREEGLKSVDELQSYFIRRIERYVNAQGRQIIGWDEILEGGLAPNAAVMSWRGEEGGIAAARQRHLVVMTPGDYCYLDHYQSDAPGEPVAFGGMTTLKTAYGYDPVPSSLSPEEARYIEGVQGNLWTEYVPTASHAEYMIFPRATALAEVGWTPVARKNFADFTRRLEPYLRRLDQLGVNYAKHVFELHASTASDEHGAINVTLSGAFEHPIHYTLDGSTPTTASPLYTGPIPIGTDARLTAAVFVDGVAFDQMTKSFVLHKAVGKHVTLAVPPDSQYNRGGNAAWVDGVMGSDAQVADDEWLGWNGVDFQGTIDFGRPETLHSLRLRFFHRPSDWIWAPTKVTVRSSDDGIHFYTVGETDVQPAGDSLTKTVLIDLHAGTSRYLQITADCVKKIPVGYTGSGDKAWLFVDEAVVE